MNTFAGSFRLGWGGGGAVRGGGEGGGPYKGLYSKAPPKRGTFFRLQVYESYRDFTSWSTCIWKDWVWNISFWSDRCILWLWKSQWNVADFVIYLHFKESTFTAVKRVANFLARYVKGVPFVIRCTRGVSYLLKMVYKWVGGWTLGPPLKVFRCSLS